MEKGSFFITNRTKGTLPRVPFENIKNSALGKNYSLSLVFIGEKKSRELNRTYRGKDRPTDILSFIIDTDEGEIFITEKIARKKMLEFGRNYTNFIAFLFIHGCMHLKGLNHGTIMERSEEKIRKQFGI